MLGRGWRRDRVGKTRHRKNIRCPYRVDGDSFQVVVLQSRVIGCYAPAADIFAAFFSLLSMHLR
jgi:hypothetical protein